MSITRLQQARQMYALGQRVRFRGGGRDAASEDFDSPSADTGDTDADTGSVDTGDLGTEAANVAANVSANMDARDRARMNQYRNVPTPTITVGVDKFNNPITVPTTYTAKRNRQIALDALNKKGISVYDPRVTKRVNPFNLSLTQPKQKQFNLIRDFVLPAGLTLVNPGLAAKYQKAKTAYTVAKNLANVAQTIGLTDKNVVDAFTSSFTDKVSNLGSGKKSTKSTTTKSTTTKDNNTFTGGGADRDMSALNLEYLMLLDKFNTGVFTDADEVRFTLLQKILGK